ncbi:hypothetical protein, partial [Streptococcus pseudopneumoniae]|uniref:hypothetical protein n=1 Tax=Streptococcus pseudopneumoniae TaxID=257758 RepID=UPI00195536F0
ASFLVCSLIFIEYKPMILYKNFTKKSFWVAKWVAKQKIGSPKTRKALFNATSSFLAFSFQGSG